MRHETNLPTSELRIALAAKARLAQGQASDVPSPCMAVCRIDAARGLCEGCLRTLDEIAAWSRLDDAGKRNVWRTIEVRACQGPPT
ncbi:MAG: DUF1289 domain-containing protein [Janthinobacterium lividum]